MHDDRDAQVRRRRKARRKAGMKAGRVGNSAIKTKSLTAKNNLLKAEIAEARKGN